MWTSKFSTWRVVNLLLLTWGRTFSSLDQEFQTHLHVSTQRRAMQSIQKERNLVSNLQFCPKAPDKNWVLTNLFPSRFMLYSSLLQILLRANKVKTGNFRHNYTRNVNGLQPCLFCTWFKLHRAKYVCNSNALKKIHKMSERVRNYSNAVRAATLCSSESCWCLMRASLLGNCLRHSRQASLTQSVILPSFSSLSPPSSSLSVSPV